MNSVPPDSLPLPLPLQQELDLPQQVAAFIIAPPAIDLPCCFLLVQDTGVFLLIMVPFQPEEDATQMRRWSGIPRVVEVPRDTQFLAHPSVGGVRGYDIHAHEMMVELCKSGNPVPQMMIRSIQRWVDGCDRGPLSPTVATAVEEDGAPSGEDQGIDGGECVGQAEWRGRG